MTNSDAFEQYYDNQQRAELVLSVNNIDPTASDALEVSSAWGMMERAQDPDYKQGNTSETLSGDARKSMITRANSIFAKYGVERYDKPTISARKW